MIHLGMPSHLSKPKLLTFVYVVAYRDHGDELAGLSFLSHQVSATDEHAAYDKGFSWLESTHDTAGMTLVNDYVHLVIP